MSGCLRVVEDDHDTWPVRDEPASQPLAAEACTENEPLKPLRTRTNETPHEFFERMRHETLGRGIAVVLCLVVVVAYFRWFA